MKISLKAARVNAGLTLNEVAEATNKSEKTISNWERGITNTPARFFYELCKLYDINPDYVVVPLVDDGVFNG